MRPSFIWKLFAAFLLAYTSSAVDLFPTPCTLSPALKADIDGIELHGGKWSDFVATRPCLEAYAILQAMKTEFKTLFQERTLAKEVANLVPEDLVASNLVSENTVPVQVGQVTIDNIIAVVFSSGGNALDGLLTGLLCHFHGISVVGLKSREANDEETAELKVSEDSRLAKDLLNALAKARIVNDINRSAVDAAIRETLKKKTLVRGSTFDEKVKNCNLYIKSIQTALLNSSKSYSTREKTWDSISNTLNATKARLVAGYKAHQMVDDLVKLMRKLKIPIVEATEDYDSANPDIFTDHCNKNYRIVAALDALNGAGKQDTLIFPKAYFGLNVLRHLKGKGARIIGIDGTSFEENLIVSPTAPESDLQKLNEDSRRVVPSHVDVLVNGFRAKAPKTLKDGFKVYLGIPGPVQEVFDYCNALDPAPYPFTQSWVASETPSSQPTSDMFQDPNTLLKYFNTLSVTSN